ncbi:MAG: hypothetical protein RIS70_3493 [Planctomycetota bacterium]
MTRCLSRAFRNWHSQAFVVLASAASTLVLASPWTVPASADEPAKEPAKITFEERVLPILKAHCVKCHAGAEPANGLRLTSRHEILKGGKSGPAMRIAAAESSLLWEKLAGNAMPKGGPPLNAEEKGIIRSWINDGALTLDSTGESTDAAISGDVDQAREHWAFQPAKRPTWPSSSASLAAQTPIDRFLLDRLQAKGLHYSPAAPRAALLRRTFYDLIGLPPSPDDVDGYLNDDDPASYDRLLDRLLASPYYGERWGRHWLDLAGYADSAGVLAEDRPIPNAFRYRDYVIRALNSDKPYDRFLQEQLAGDELVDYWNVYESSDHLPEHVVEAITATGYLRCAPDSSRPDFSTIKNADAQYFYPTLNDTMQIVSSSTMGLTLQCARCHSHKYDPIPQVEYYRLQAIFMPAFRPKQWIPQMERRLLIASASQKKAADEKNGKIDAEVARLKKENSDQRASYKQKHFDEQLAALPEVIRDDVKQALTKPAEQQSPVDKYLADKFRAALQPDDKTLDTLLPKNYPDYRTALEQRNAAIASQESQRVHFDEIRALYDLPGPVTTPVLQRGDALTPGAPVEPGVLTSIASPVSFQWTPPADNAKTSGRRLAFARWLTHPDHPLTSRVLVNRLWLQHFGEGIVATPEDFGALGAAPSHPQLLDWLARDFVETGWSIKSMHRRIMLSTAYAQGSAILSTGADAGGDENTARMHRHAQEVDPDNRLLWRQRMRRVEAEPIRDTMLDVAGMLDRRLYGVPVPMARRADGEVTVADGNNDRRRSIYMQVLRSNPLTMLQSHDQPVMETNCTRRTRSTVSTQALTLLNSDTTIAYALAFADRVLREQTDAPIRYAIQFAYGRPASDDELATLTEFYQSQQSRYTANGQAAEVSRRHAMADLCQMLMLANEFVFVD